MHTVRHSAAVHTAAHRLEVMGGCPLQRPASWPEWAHRAAHNAARPCISSCPAAPHRNFNSRDQESSDMEGLSGARPASIKLDAGDTHRPAHEWHVM